MSAPRTSDCRKFSPNIFNKSKCSHCFRQREEHSAAALECNRASRKVSKCGYLFVAPDWDFSNPLYRTKRWQRRWFVLYDDGELTYSVDEHPETVPQACIDMTKVLEVTTAEDVTGNTNSIAITAPDRVTFVKGTCPEESKWWLNILAAFPKSKGRHKRNATFPGGQATTILQTNSDSGSGSTTRNRHNSYHKDALTSAQSAGVLIGSPGGVGGGGGVSVSIGSSSGDSDESWQQVGRERPNNVDADDDDVDDDDDDNENVDDDDEDDGVETGEDEEDEQEEEEMNVADEKKAKNKSKVSTNSGGQDENNRNAGNEITNRVSAPSTCLLIEDIRRDEKTIKDIANTITNLSQQQKSRWSTTTVNNVLNSHLQTASRDETDFGHRQQQQQPTQTTIVSLRPKSLPLASNSTPAIVSAIVKKIPPVMVNNSSNNNQNNNTNNHNNNNNNNNNNMNNMSGDSNNNNPLNNNIRCKSSPRLQLQLKHLQQQHQLQQQQQHQQNNQQQQLKRHQSREKPMQTHERGDPDGGCNLDDLSTSCYLAKTAELRVNVPLEEATAKSGATTTGSTTKAAKTTSVTASTSSSSSPPCSVLNEKKGWLMKQDNRTGDWTKHWFTLSGAALFYYRDPVSEERGVLDGVLDVNSLTSVSAEVVGGANKNYAFQLITWDKRRLTLASLSPNSRLSWIALLRQAAGLQTAPTAPTTTTATPMDPAKPASVSVEDDDIKSEIEKDFIKAQRSQELLIGGYQEANNNSTSTPSSSSSMIGSKNKLSETSPQVLLVNGGANNANSANNSTAATTTTTAKPTALSPVTPSTPKTPGGHFSSDEEYRTASEGGRRDSVDWGSPLSPSPPLPLSLSSLLRAKDRMRPRTTQCPSLHKRSRSSPPSSRRSTVDSVGSDELPPSIRSQTVHEELLHIDQELKFRLSVAEKERDMLRDEAKEREARMSELLTTLERTEQELTARIQEMEAARDHLSAQLGEAKRNAEKIIGRLTEELQESHKKIKSLEDRLSRGIEENETLYKRMRELENDSPSSFGHHHHHPLQLNLNLTRSKLKRMDSLSDLTHINDIDPYGLERDHLAEEYNELRSRFEKAVNEIRAMKRELKESQNQFDSLEISYASLKQDLERRELEDRSQLQMMAERIQDLTLKYSGSERQVRLLKQKLAKSERRRSLSLKGGKEQLSISKELELKVADLETKLDEWEKATTAIISTSSVITATAVTPSPTTTSSVRSSQGTEGGPKQQQKKSSRRRSLESSASADSLQFMVRVNDLEKRLEGVSGCSTPTPPGLESPRCPSSSCSTTSSTSCSNSASPSPKASEHLLKRLRCLEGVLIASKDRLEQSLQQLQTLRSTRTRRSVSPITDRKDSYRLVERCLGEVVKLLRESCDSCIIAGSLAAFPPPTGALIALPESSPIKAALVQLETQLRTKLADLLKQRRVLRERNELTSSKDLELLAERVAFESVCFGKLRDSVTRAENPQLFGERQTRAEVAETSHLITMLKAKLSGKCSFKPSGSVDILAGVLARRLVLSGYRKDIATTPTTTPSSKLEPVDPNILEDLRRQQNELNLIAKRYKNHAMENLASGLAAETLSYISSNDLVQGAVQEAWRQAQETVNAELVQSEIAHIMMRHAERFEYAVQPSFGYTLTAEERLTFENFADAVHEALRKEMELAVAQLTHCYEEAIQTMKRGQWRLHLEQERKASEGRQLLAEFADIVAHKALVDARIAVLCGAEPAPRSITIGDDANDDVDDASKDGDSKDLRQRRLGITALQRYESLFEELSSDLQISHPDDILAEADFEFLYRQQTLDFLSDRQVLAEISTFLGQLEDSLIALQCEAVSTTSVARSAISIESLQDVCRKCCDLRQRADQLLQDVQRKLQAPCPHCLQVREKLYAAQQQHDADVQRLQQTHAEDVAQLRQQLENQRNAIKSLEAEREEFDERMREQEERVERRQDELRAVEQKLRQREDELQSEQRERREQLERRLGEQDEKMRAFREESDALAMKCARQDEEYAVLLQERDYLQAELEKERERSRRFEKRLEMLELEHGKQLECLQEAYREQILSHCSDFPNITDEESFRQRYQAEIEQLKKLCEKGLSAMESSHRRIISDLEEKHRQEIERLLIEKETALAEETQATLAALDAMRKAHQSEVQREVARFKQEFLHQFQKGEHTPDAARIKEEELEELRREILSFSEKYSIKCVENAALEEKLRAVNQKLKHFQQMQQLELRNKQFRAHLASDDPLTDAAFVQGLNASKDDATCPDSEPVKHAIEMRMECENKLKLKPRPQQQVQENHLKHTPDNNTKTRLQQSFFVIPSASLLRPATISAPVVRCPSKDDDRDHGGDDNSEKQDAANDAADNDNDNVNDNDGGGGIDNDDDHDDDADDDRTTISDDDSIYRYSYEPCYKQNNLYSYQNRISFEGLKSSTFGKNLKTITKSLKTAKTTTKPTKTAIPTTAANTTTKTPTPTTSSPASSKVLSNQLFKNTATIKINASRNAAKTNATTNSIPTTTTATITKEATEQMNYNYYKQYLQKQQLQQQQQKCSLTTEALTTNPVEEPKNINLNKTINNTKNNQYIHNNNHNNNNIIINPNNNCNNKSYNLIEHEEKQQKQAETFKIVNFNINNNNHTTTTATIKTTTSNLNNKTSVNKTLAATPTTATATCLKVAEKTAISLESFADIIKKTVNEQQQQQQQQKLQQLTTVENAKDDDDDVGDDDDVVNDDDDQKKQQQQQRQPSYNNSSGSTAKTIGSSANTQQQQLPRSGQPCSRPPLSGRDDEQQQFVATGSSAPTSPLRRFELEI